MPGPYYSFDSLPVFDPMTQGFTVRGTAYRDNGSPTPTPIEGYVGVPVRVVTPTLAGIKLALATWAALAEQATSSDIATASAGKIFDPTGAILNP